MELEREHISAVIYVQYCTATVRHRAMLSRFGNEKHKLHSEITSGIIFQKISEKYHF